MESHNFNEQLKESVRQKIEIARANAILDSRLEELKGEMYKYSSRQDEEARMQEDLIEKEILNSSVVAKDLTEFVEALRQIKEKYNQTDAWAKTILAHENAHANVSEQTGHPYGEYFIIFIKDENNNIGIQPVYFNKPDRSWGEVEILIKRIATTDAPRVYGEELSPGDEEDLEKDRRRLEELEETNAEEIGRVKKSLGVD